IAMLGELLPPQGGGGVHVGDAFLTERLHALAVQRTGSLWSPAPTRRCQASAPAGAGERMEGDQIRPETSCFLPQRLALGERGGREPPPGHEADDTLRRGALVGHRPPPFTANTGEYRTLARTDGCQRRGRRFIPRLKPRAFSPLSVTACSDPA